MYTVKVKQKYNYGICHYKRRETGKVKERFDTSGSEKGWKAYIFLRFNELIFVYSNIVSNKNGLLKY